TGSAGLTVDFRFNSQPMVIPAPPYDAKPMIRGLAVYF
ncbi:MAG: hypothetical protein ACI96W_002649, partial [Paraglaciecola sp.]